MSRATPGREHWTRVTLLEERGAARVARLVIGVAIYVAAALMLLS